MEFITTFVALRAHVLSRQQLLAAGYTSRQLTAGVRSRRLLRLREGWYALPGCDSAIQAAVRIGGLVTCVSALRRLGVWVADEPFAHVALVHGAARLRHPRDRLTRLTPESSDGTVLHWQKQIDQKHARNHRVSTIDALAHLVRCQPEHLVVASLDSALYEKRVSSSELVRLFDGLPHKYRSIRTLIDGRCMSGIESLVRLILMELGLPFELQVKFTGIGTVDFVVAGVLVIETDGKLGHVGEGGQLRDYDRDLALISLGLSVLRLNYPQVMFRRGEAIAGIQGALAAHRGFAR